MIIYLKDIFYLLKGGYKSRATGSEPSTLNPSCVCSPTYPYALHASFMPLEPVYVDDRYMLSAIYIYTYMYRDIFINYQKP